MLKTFSLAVVGAFVSLQAFAGGGAVETVASVDLNKYIGKWYEVASIPQSFQKQCVGNTTAEYSLVDGGYIKVLNTCDTQSGSRSVAEGRARVEDTRSNSKLKVTFVKFIDWIFTFGGAYWILDLPEDYSYAVVGDPTREYAWILARTANPGVNVLAKAERKLKEQGYDTCKVLTSVQTGGYSTRIPLCEAVKTSQDVVDLAVSAGKFKTLLALVQLAGEEELLRSEGPFTVFAPTDEAFAKLGEEKINQIVADKQLLFQVLMNHLVLGEKRSLGLVRKGSVETLAGTTLQVKTTSAGTFVNDAKISAADVSAKNGVLHVIDTVLIPQ